MNDTVEVTIAKSVKVHVSNISVIALLKISGAVAVGALWTAMLVNVFG